MRTVVQEATCGPQCLLAHSFVNKLSIIVGECELLDTRANPEFAHRLRVIRQTALDMAAQMNGHRCEVRRLLHDNKLDHKIGKKPNGSARLG
ncbi:MAG: hypothetical protein WCB53_19975 [Terriglobales bacterium]